MAGEVELPREMYSGSLIVKMRGKGDAKKVVRVEDPGHSKAGWRNKTISSNICLRDPVVGAHLPALSYEKILGLELEFRDIKTIIERDADLWSK